MCCDFYTYVRLYEAMGIFWGKQMDIANVSFHLDNYSVRPNFRYTLKVLNLTTHLWQSKSEFLMKKRASIETTFIATAFGLFQEFHIWLTVTTGFPVRSLESLLKP